VFLEKEGRKKRRLNTAVKLAKPGQSTKKLRVKARLAKFLVLVRLAGEIYDTLSFATTGASF